MSTELKTRPLRRLDRGWYETADGRFRIRRSWDPIWEVEANNDSDKALLMRLPRTYFDSLAEAAQGLERLPTKAQP